MRMYRFAALWLITVLVPAAVLAQPAARAGLGAESVWASGERAMISRVPQWIAYAAIVPPLAFTAVVGLYTAWESLQQAISGKG